MALPILDGNQSATTLSTILSSGQHITAHTVVSLGTQAITDIVNATSANLTNTQLRASAVTVGGTVTVGNTVTIAGTVTANPTGTQTIAGTVTAGNLPIYNETDTILDGNVVGSIVFNVNGANAFGASGITVGSIPSLPAGTNRIGVVTIGAGTVTIGSGTAQIGSVTASLSGWELLGQRDFFADASNWQFNSSVIGLYSSLGITFGDGSSDSIQATYLTSGGQDNDLYWSSLDGTRTRIITSGSGLFTTTAIPADITISVFSTPSSSQTASLYGKKDNALPLTNTQLRGSALTISGTVTIGSALPSGANRIGVVTIGGGTVTIGAGTAQIGSVTASISGTVPISISSVTVGNSVTISSLPALVAGTAQIGSVTASISNSVTIASLPAISGTVTANTFAVQGTDVTTSNFTSTTASTVLAGFNAGREVLTIFNEGAGNLYICAGATCTTIAYQVRLSAGDYYEVPNHQTTITHSAVFASAGTARVTQVS